MKAGAGRLQAAGAYSGGDLQNPPVALPPPPGPGVHALPERFRRSHQFGDLGEKAPQGKVYMGVQG